jgi:hypothetical protein
LGVKAVKTDCTNLNMNIIDRIADHADIDTRRALGYPPRKLPKIDFAPKTIRNIEYWYYIQLKKLVYFEYESYADFYYEVVTDVELIDRHFPPRFITGANSRVRMVRYTEKNTEVFDKENGWKGEFHTAGMPVLISGARSVV